MYLSKKEKTLVGKDEILRPAFSGTQNDKADLVCNGKDMVKARKDNILSKSSNCFLPHPPSPSPRSREGELGVKVSLRRVLKCILTILLGSFFLFFSPLSSAEETQIKHDITWFADNIRIEGNRFFESEKLLSQIKLKTSFSAGLLEKNIDQILTLYEDNGFPYCQVSPSDFRISEKGGFSLSLLVEEGPRVKIKEIQLDGLKTTKKKVILRELGTDIFSFFSQSRLERSLARLKRLSYIKGVEETELLAGENPEDGVLRISLVETKNNTFSGILGYAPSTANRKGTFFGSMELIFDDMFGTGRRTEWSWSRKDPYSTRFLFLYREPWIFSLPPTLELNLSQLDYDSTYLQLSFSAKLVFNSNERLSWGLEGGWEKVVPGSAGKAYLPDSRKYRMGIICSLDLLDQPDNPRKGILYQIEIDYAQKRNYPTPLFTPEKQKVYLSDLSLDLNNFLPTLKSQTFLVGMHHRSLSTNENMIPLPDQFKLGGINSIRGYREEEFFGTMIAWANLEYRFLLEGNSRFFLFTDYGYFERKIFSSNNEASRKISGKKLGYGFGLRIDSKAGLLGIDYGLGEGDSFSQGKIHFGVVNRF
jgi:outer membrane protein insertion porin family